MITVPSQVEAGKGMAFTVEELSKPMKQDRRHR